MVLYFGGEQMRANLKADQYESVLVHHQARKKKTFQAGSRRKIDLCSLTHLTHILRYAFGCRVVSGRSHLPDFIDLRLLNTVSPEAVNGMRNCAAPTGCQGLAASARCPPLYSPSYSWCGLGLSTSSLPPLQLASGLQEVFHLLARLPFAGTLRPETLHRPVTRNK